MNFYKDPIVNRYIYVCKQGHLSLDGTCITGSVTSATGLSLLKSKKQIAPYLMSSLRAVNNPTYCSSSAYTAFRWNDGVYQSEAILYSTGEIRFVYSSSIPANIAEVGISYDNSGTYYNELTNFGSTTSNDYKLTF
jgi:hypothetical protein